MKKKMIYLRIWGQMRPGVFLFHIYFKQNANETHGIIIENGLHHPSIRAGYQVSGPKLHRLSAGTIKEPVRLSVAIKP